MTKPIAVSCGEPAGIGAEISAKAWQALKEDVPFFLIGDPGHMPPGTCFEVIADPAETADVCKTALPVLPHSFAAPNKPGQPNAANAQGVIDVIRRGVELVQQGAATGLCTAPIRKKALIDGAGFSYPGHTEFLAALTGVQDVVMMLAGPSLRVVPATIHIALADVPQALNADGLRETLMITHKALQNQFGIPAPRVAVAGLNPHAGEGGAMGREEIDWIADLIAELRSQGMDISGPHSADTLFHAEARSHYDVAVAMYHDQALIPIKTLDFDKGVNVTLGLPIIRTSPDHGTALDIAGQDKANPTSMIEALKLAHHMASAS